MSGHHTWHRALARVRRPSARAARCVRVVLCVSLVLSSCNADPGYQGRSSREWMAQLAEGNADERVDAALALGKVLMVQPNAPTVINALVGALGDTSDALRVTAAEGLRNAVRGERRVQERVARDAVPGIVALLADSQHVAVRRDAARILGMLGAAAAAGTVAPLGRALQDPEPAVRHAAALALAGLGDQAQAAVPSLLAASQDPDLDVRQRVLGALAAGAAPASVVGPALVRGLRDSAAVVREAVAIGLGQRRPHGVRALGGEQGATASPLRALRAATRDPVTGVRLAAVTSLGLLGDSAGRPDLERALTDPDAVVRREAAHALTALHRRGGRDPSPPEPSLFELCRSNPRWPGC